jgi:orotate phosphoribosyltransferase
MNSEPLHEELLALLVRRRGHFRLESGHHGDVWLDLDPLFLRPTRLRRFAAALALGFANLAIEGVCGPQAGGAFVAQAVAADRYFVAGFLAVRWFVFAMCSSPLRMPAAPVIICNRSSAESLSAT